jgi:hypothetical protein
MPTSARCDLGDGCDKVTVTSITFVTFVTSASLITACPAYGINP